MIFLKMCAPLNRSLGWSSVWCSVVPFATAGRSSKLDPWPLPRKTVNLSPSLSRDPGHRSKKSFPLWCSNLAWSSSILAEFVFIICSHEQSSFHNILIRLTPSTYPMGTVQYLMLSWQSVKLFCPHGHLATITNVNPNTGTVVSMLFHTALTLTPRLWESLAPERAIWGESSWVCLSVRTHERAQTHKHSNVV